MSLFSHPETPQPVARAAPPRPDPVAEVLARAAVATDPAHTLDAARQHAPRALGIPQPPRRRIRTATPGEPTGPATRTPGTHPCPGCAADVFDHLLACRACWARLPRTHRERVVRGWSRDELVAAGALVEAVGWWRTHPRR